MGRPVIGIVGNLLLDRGDVYPGYERAYVNNDYVQSVLKAGGIPFIMPIVLDDETVKLQVESVDGILVTGGSDVNPLLYGEEPQQKLGPILTERDEYDLKVINYANEMTKPILGICRGLQIMNVAFGGTLYQDLKETDWSYIKHSQEAKPEVAAHTVNISKGTKLIKMLGDKIVTNSFHHQAVKELAPEFVISAYAKDGVIEAIEREGEEFIVAVQWHPEMMAAKGDSAMLSLFKRLVEEAK